MISRIERISSFDAPELRPYATMRRPAEHETLGIFVAEGEKVVRRLLESRFTVVSAVFWEKWLDDFRPLLEARHERIPVYLAEKKWLETLTGFAMFQGVLAVGKIPAPVSFEDFLHSPPCEIPPKKISRIEPLNAADTMTRPPLPSPPWGRGIEGEGENAPRLFAAVDGLTNSENLGALVRNCAAFGVQALFVGETSGSPFLRRAVRNSMGAIFQLPVVELGKEGKTLAQTLRALRERGVRCIAAHPHGNKQLLDADFKRDCCIVFGSEGPGISQAVLESCDDAVAIPISASVDSLNVGAAAAVFLYEAERQRKMSS